MNSDERKKLKYSISLSFEEVKLPKLQEILVLGKNAAVGKHGVAKCFEFLVPNEFETIEIIDDANVDVIFVNKRVLVKLPKEKLLSVLRYNVFPYVSEGELIRVDLKIIMFYDLIEEKKL